MRKNRSTSGYAAASVIKTTLHKIPKFHINSWCGNLAERRIFRRVSGESPESLRKLCLSTKFAYQDTDILRITLAVA